MGAVGESGATAPEETDRRRRYALAVGLSALAIVSQYFVPELVPGSRAIYGSFVGDLFVVYGIPIVLLATLVGTEPLRRFAGRPVVAAWEGLRWYGGLWLLGLGISVALVAIYSALDPAALDLLTRPNPVVQEAASDPWFWVGFSFAVGAIEETIFRGWIFGFWTSRPGLPWWVHATWTSALFAGVHLYYGITYGIAAPFFYPVLFLLGFAFAATYQASGGNLVVVALLHGANDAASFLRLISPGAGLGLQLGLVAIGLLIAALHARGWRAFRPAPRPPAPPPVPPPPWVALPPTPAGLPPPPPPEPSLS